MDASLIAAGVSLLGSFVMALVAWGWRAEIATLRAEMATMRAEVRASIAESGLTFYGNVNGNYIKRDLFMALSARVDGIEMRVTDAGE